MAASTTVVRRSRYRFAMPTVYNVPGAVFIERDRTPVLWRGAQFARISGDQTIVNGAQVRLGQLFDRDSGRSFIAAFDHDPLGEA